MLVALCEFFNPFDADRARTGEDSVGVVIGGGVMRGSCRVPENAGKSQTTLNWSPQPDWQSTHL